MNKLQIMEIMEFGNLEFENLELEIWNWEIWNWKIWNLKIWNWEIWQFGILKLLIQSWISLEPNVSSCKKDSTGLIHIAHVDTMMFPT